MGVMEFAPLSTCRRGTSCTCAIYMYGRMYYYYDVGIYATLLKYTP